MEMEMEMVHYCPTCESIHLIKGLVKCIQYITTCAKIISQIYTHTHTTDTPFWGLMKSRCCLNGSNMRMSPLCASAEEFARASTSY